VGGKSQIYEAYLDDFAIGPARPTKGRVRVLDELGDRAPYHAIAGVPYLMQMDLEVALADKDIKFFHAKGCDDAFLAYWDRHAVVIPYRRDGAPYPVFSIEVNGDLMSAIIDTGATRSAITASAVRKFGLGKGKPEPGQLRYTTGVGTRQVPTWTVHTKSIKIGGETILDADIQVIDDRKESVVDVVLGADFLRAHRVLFAISQQNIYLSYLGGDVFVPHPTVEPWMRKEAEDGNPDAQMRLALSYLSGKGAPRDDALAQAWLDKAAALGHLDANLFDGYRRTLRGCRTAPAGRARQTRRRQVRGTRVVPDAPRRRTAGGWSRRTGGTLCPVRQACLARPGRRVLSGSNRPHPVGVAGSGGREIRPRTGLRDARPDGWTVSRTRQCGSGRPAEGGMERILCSAAMTHASTVYFYISSMYFLQNCAVESVA
jgi:hypothetical protein